MVASCSRYLVDEPLEVTRRGLGLGREPGDGDLLEPVAVGEVPERGVARHDLAPLAVDEALLELAVELAQALDEVGRGSGPAEDVADPGDQLCISERVEPDVRIRILAELDPAQQVDRLAVGSLDGVLDGRLEARAEVEDKSGRPHRLDVPDRELDVVRLGAGRGQVRDLRSWRCDLLRRERKRVEAGDDVGSLGSSGRPAGDRQWANKNENNYRSHSRLD